LSGGIAKIPGRPAIRRFAEGLTTTGRENPDIFRVSFSILSEHRRFFLKLSDLDGICPRRTEYRNAEDFTGANGGPVVLVMACPHEIGVLPILIGEGFAALERCYMHSERRVLEQVFLHSVLVALVLVVGCWSWCW
jgi:hypothetical protein